MLVRVDLAEAAAPLRSSVNISSRLNPLLGPLAASWTGCSLTTGRSVECSSMFVLLTDIKRTQREIFVAWFYKMSH